MKRIFYLLLFLVAAGGSYAQKANKIQVPATVADALKKAHPDATPKWEREGSDYEANFKEGGKAMSCIIDKQGTILETESTIAASELPTAAATYLRTHYKGKSLKEIEKIVKHDGKTSYEVSVGGKEILFDSNGTPEKTETKKD